MHVMGTESTPAPDSHSPSLARAPRGTPRWPDGSRCLVLTATAAPTLPSSEAVYPRLAVVCWRQGALQQGGVSN